MANQDKLYVIVTNDPSGFKNGESSKDSSDEKTTGWGKVGKFAVHEAIHILKSSINESISYSINQIGNIEGNYYKQQQVQNAYNIVNKTISLGMAALAGAKIGSAAGPVGTAIGAALGAGTVAALNAVTFNFKINEINTQNYKTNYEIFQLRQKAGLNTKYDGSRGTLG